MEAVNHPSHYGGDTTYEAIKVIEEWELGFHLGNTVKYISRAGKKNADKEIEDLEKAAWYLERKIKQLKLKRENAEQKAAREARKDQLKTDAAMQPVIDKLMMFPRVVKKEKK